MIHTKSVNPALGLRALVAGVWFGAGMGRGSAGEITLMLTTSKGVPRGGWYAVRIKLTATTDRIYGDNTNVTLGESWG